ncbi:hypothetical protein DL98DRAFT_525980 [Cadophora sp. DSE1049]|nr:hypothetical protein DL98DRAFT_525980 [Cadophora sp. DSE1049]
MKAIIWATFLCFGNLANSQSTGYNIDGFQDLALPAGQGKEVDMKSCHYVITNFLTAASGTGILIRSGSYFRFGQNRCVLVGPAWPGTVWCGPDGIDFIPSFDGFWMVLYQRWSWVHARWNSESAIYQSARKKSHKKSHKKIRRHIIK